VVPEHRPDPVLLRLEVDLDDLAGGVAAHDDVKEHLADGYVEEVGVVDEGDVDTARVIGVGVDDLEVAPRQRCVEDGNEQFEDEAVLDLAHAEQVGPGAAVHLRDHRGELGDLAVAPLRGPAARSLPIVRCSFSVRLGESSSSKRFSRFHQAM
jgi:hypothetical protein